MDLVLLVCLASSPASCHEERLLMSYGGGDPRTCMMGAAPVIAEWSGDHPEFAISRWTCGTSREARLSQPAQ